MTKRNRDAPGNSVRLSVLLRVCLYCSPAVTKPLSQSLHNSLIRYSGFIAPITVTKIWISHRHWKHIIIIWSIKMRHY